jgi:hypothetical protein
VLPQVREQKHKKTTNTELVFFKTKAHELHSGLLGWWAENWAIVVPSSTNSTESSVKYKLRSGFADYLSFWIASSWAVGMKIVFFFVLCPTNSTEISVIYKLTSGLADYFKFCITCSRARGLKIGLLVFRGLQK